MNVHWSVQDVGRGGIINLCLHPSHRIVEVKIQFSKDRWIQSIWRGQGNKSGTQGRTVKLPNKWKNKSTKYVTELEGWEKDLGKRK